MCIRDRLKDDAGIHSQVVDLVLGEVAEAIRAGGEDLQIYTSGATNIFKYPELTEGEKASQLIGTLEHKEVLQEFVSEVNAGVEGDTGIQVYIGDESPVQSMKDCSCLLYTSSSIMSKKLAAGSDSIVLDVKTGSGAFMKTLDESICLAKKMVSIGCMAGRRCCALITNMDIPLGYAIGNSLEMTEAIRTLKGEGPEDLTRVCLELAANMLHLAGRGTVKECRKMAEETIHDGSALKRLALMVKAQGGDESFIWKPEQFGSPACAYEVKAPAQGYISHMDTEGIGTASVLLGAGRNTKEDPIDYGAGIVLKKKYGEKVLRPAPKSTEAVPMPSVSIWEI